jgi:Flp pilus assembly protein TadD
VELKALNYSAIFGSLTTKQMIDTGIALMNSGELSDAEIALKRVVTLEPKERRGHIQLGRVYILMNRYKEASEQFNIVLRLGGEDFQAYYGLGLLAYTEKRFSDSETFLRKAMEHTNSKTREEDKEKIRELLKEIQANDVLQ